MVVGYGKRKTVYRRVCSELIYICPILEGVVEGHVVLVYEENAE